MREAPAEAPYRMARIACASAWVTWGELLMFSELQRCFKPFLTPSSNSVHQSCTSLQVQSCPQLSWGTSSPAASALSCARGLKVKIASVQGQTKRA